MTIRNGSRALVAAALVSVALAGAAVAGPPAAKRVAQPARGTGVKTFVGDRHLDINQFNMWVSNFGAFAGRQDAYLPGLIYPRGSQDGVIYAAGIWLGAQVGGETRVVTASYSQEFAPGPMSGGTFTDPSNPDHVVYKVMPFLGDSTDTARVMRTPADVFEDPLVHHSWSEYMRGAAPYGAPWKMYRLPVTSTPAPDDSVDVPGPDVLGNQMMWCVYNDADASRHTDDPGRSAPLGVEIQQTLFGFDRQGPLGTTAFVKFKIINKGANTLDQMYVSLWSDPDLGGAADDLVGCDPALGLGYCYNATNNDLNYGAVPPAIGFDFLRGPKVGGNYLGLTSFNKYINGTDPQQTTESYNYMQGLKPDGSPLTDPNGVVTTYYHSGNPVTGSGWLDSNPADRRFMNTSGPFTMAPGDTQEVVAAIVLGRCGDRLSSIEAMKFNDRFAQAAFDSLFVLPDPPARPAVVAAIDHSTVRLSWDTRSEVDRAGSTYKFQGYVVYQGASASGPWKRLATYDVVDDAGRIRDNVYDLASCSEYSDFIVAYGENTGTRYAYVTTKDAIRGGDLNDGTEYYYAVTAYSYDPLGFPKVLENAQEVIRVMPQRAPAGTDYGTATVSDIAHSVVDPDQGPATDVVTVDVIDPAQVTGHQYRVTFTPFSPPYPTFFGAEVTYGWNLIDVTTGDTLLYRQLNKTGSGEYRVIDGLMVKVRGAYKPAFQDAAYLDLVTTNPPGLAGINWGGAYFDGSADTGWNFWGGTLDPAVDPDSFTTVQVRFSSTATQKAYRYLRLETGTGGAPNGDREYRYAGFHDVAFQAWDVSRNVQLDVGWTERAVTDDAGSLQPPASQPASFDSTWAPTDNPDDGDREYLFILNRPYSDTPKAEFEVDAALDGAPILWAVWAYKPDAGAVIDDGDAFEWLWAKPATSNDVYDFDTSPLVRDDRAVAKANLDRVRVVPNPYYTRSIYELNPFNRVVRFINLPERCTIRIFNLAGDLVRTLDKTDALSSVLEWDLQTRNRLPVGSGVYVYHIDAPGVGSVFGRMAVFMEKERLTTY